MTQIGRIRLGTSEPITKNGKKYRRPVKLDRFRFTSSDHVAIQAVAEQLGGEVRPWAAAPTIGQWEVITEATSFDVAVPPGPAAVSQWYEHWSEGGCARRCDGATEQKAQEPCLCDPDQRLCRPTTRVSLILADVPGLGVWMLESHGWNAAAEMGGMAEFLATVREAGAIVPAVLRAEVRRSVSEGQTKDFVVPVLTVRSTMRELATAWANPSSVMLPPAPRGLAITAGAAPSEPETAQDMATWAQGCKSLEELQGAYARLAHRRGWMSEFVQSRYHDEMIELVEVFRARRAELLNPDGVQ